MGALPPISPWIPEDDLLLKNAVEAGASLESLAKGAVRFSRRFSIREIQERWHSLLYDQDISSEAAELMTELERRPSNLTFNKSSRVETTKDSREDRKRNYKSVRKSYYEMRKRIRNDPLNQGDLNFHVPLVGNCYGDGNEDLCPSNILEDPMASHFELGNTNFDGVHHVFDNRDKVQLENYPIEQSKAISLGGNSTAIGGTNLSKDLYLPEPFEDNIDVNTMGDSDKNKDSDIYACFEGNHVINSPVSECDTSLHHLQYSSSPPAMPVWRNIETLSAIEMASDSCLRGENPETGFGSHIPCDEMKAPTSCAQFDLVALSDTLLNLSDDDDDMFLMDDDGKEIDKYGLSNLLLDSPSDMNEDQMLDPTQADISGEPEADLHICTSAPTEQLDKSDSALEEPKISSICGTNPPILELCNIVISCSMNTQDLEIPCNDHVIFPSKRLLKSLNRKGFNKVGRRDSFMKDNLHKQDAIETSLSLVNSSKRFGELHTDSQARGHKMGMNHTSERNHQLPGVPELPELPDYDDEDSYDEEEEVPCSSYGELLVLEMDLVPQDHDWYSSRQVARYQSEDAKRTIIRLDQASHAYMHRAIACHGAFAVVYGLYSNSKHYIRKTEVLLGRATEDVFVDIDLGKHGRASKISRRQAIIKMDDDGEFHLVNLGKCPISVDDKEVYPGQSLILTSRCFVEVREVHFIFEKYHARVKQYLDAISRNTRPS